MRTVDEFGTLVDLLRGRAQYQPARPVYTFLNDGEAEEAQLTYAELDRRARAFSVVLRQTITEGARVLLLYPPGLEYITAFFGCLYAGAVAVPAYPPRRNRSLLRLESIFADADANVALTTDEILARIAPRFPHHPQLESLRWLTTADVADAAADDWHAPGITPDALAFLQYTSGSTARPKGVMLSHRNLLHNERLIQLAFRQTEHSRIVGWLPLYHDMGLIGQVVQPLYSGGSCVLMSPVAFLQKPFRWLQAISRYGATTSGGPNFAYDLCARKVTAEQRATLDLSRWEIAFNGAEPIRHETVERFAAAFAPCGFRREAFIPCYGLAEATLLVSARTGTSPVAIKRLEARALEQNRVLEADAGDANARTFVGCGRVTADQQLFIVDPDARAACEPGRVGEIWLSGASVARGYFNREAETEHTFRARLAGHDGDSFLRTGDLGFIADGELYITGRLKDLIIIRGLNHYPQDIELTVQGCHPALRVDAGAAFSLEVAGEERLIVVQEVDHRQAADWPAIIESISAAVAAAHEVQVAAVALIKAGSIPKTSSGKIQRHACRAAFETGSLNTVAERRWPDAPEHDATDEGVDAPPLAPAPESVELWLRRQLAAKLRIAPDQLDPHQPLDSFGLDSLMAIELMHDLEAGLNVTLPPTSFLESPSIAELAAHVAASPRAADGEAQRPAGRAHEAADAYPLSRGQQALWFLHQLEPTSAVNVIVVPVRIVSALDAPALRRAFQALVNRHASLRTTFDATDGVPSQRPHELVEVCFEQVDASGWSDTHLHERLAADAYRP
ncbi:MAG TPA: AMP-binding protein, partial [Pyrinomonadaceae bacterium]|nr:AMP-binding protein [Pyrinomonadaceae bacterium]